MGMQADIASPLTCSATMDKGMRPPVAASSKERMSWRSGIFSKNKIRDLSN